MNAPDPCRMSAVDLAAAIRDGALTAADAVEASLGRIHALDDRLVAFALVDAAGARRRAHALDQARAAGRRLGPLHGVPFSVKDLVVTKGMETAFGSHAMAGNVPGWEVAAVTRLRRAGAILLGKSTTPEFGHKALTNSPRHGFTRNPWDPSRSPGGSSGGAAVAVATGMHPIAVSTDGSGSARIPAAACGVLGLKPTLGLVPNEQAPELFSNFVYLGLNSRTVADLALMLTVMNGPHPGDPWSLGQRRRRYRLARDPAAALGGLRLTYIERMGNRQVDSGVVAVMRRTLDRLADAGAVVTRIDDPFDWGRETLLTMMRAYQRARLERLLPEHRDRLDPSLVEAIEEGRGLDLLAVQRAPQERSAVFQRVQGLLAGTDLIVTPTLSAPPPAFDHPHDRPMVINGEATSPLRWTWYCYTGPVNLTGHPAISIPAGFTPDGMPAGLQAIGPWFGEQRLIDLAAGIEAVQPWADAWPAIVEAA